MPKCCYCLKNVENEGMCRSCEFLIQLIKCKNELQQVHTGIPQLISYLFDSDYDVALSRASKAAILFSIWGATFAGKWSMEHTVGFKNRPEQFGCALASALGGAAIGYCGGAIAGFASPITLPATFLAGILCLRYPDKVQ
jgi:hypothetical protein